MTPRKKPTVEVDNSPDIRLGRIEVQTDYIAKAVDTLVAQFTEAEKLRINNWVEYRTSHEKLVSDCINYDRRITSVEGEIAGLMEDTEGAMKEADNKVETKFNKFAENTKVGFTDIRTLVDTLDKKISPLLFAHKILVWVTIFFASSIGLLLWGIFTHTVTLVYNH